MRLDFCDASVFFPPKLLFNVRKVRLTALPVLFLLLEPLDILNESLLADHDLIRLKAAFVASRCTSDRTVETNWHTMFSA